MRFIWLLPPPKTITRSTLVELGMGASQRHARNLGDDATAPDPVQLQRARRTLGIEEVEAAGLKRTRRRL